MLEARTATIPASRARTYSRNVSSRALLRTVSWVNCSRWKKMFACISCLMRPRVRSSSSMAAVTSAYVHLTSSVSQVFFTRRMKCFHHVNRVSKLLGEMGDDHTLVFNTTYSQSLPTTLMIVVCPAHLNPTLLNTNNLLPTNKWIKLLPAPPAILHTPVLLRTLRADLALRQPPLLAGIDSAHSDLLSRAIRATHVAAFRNATAGANVGCGETWEAGHAGNAADVPYFELLVPFRGGGAWEEDGQDGEEGEESDFELHCCCWCWCF